MSSKGTLDRLGLFSLEQRRLREDLTEVYKIMRRMDRVDRNQLFALLAGSTTRGQNIQVKFRNYKADLRVQYVFIQRTVGAWIALPEKIVEAGNIKTVSSFCIFGCRSPGLSV